MKKVKRLTAKTMLFVIAAAFVFSLLLFTVPLITFRHTPYEKVCAAAAESYGISPAEYQVQFVKDLKDEIGESVQGLYLGCNLIDGVKVFKIQISDQPLRVLMTEAIFHEFAHAAQDKYDLSFGKYTREQHAEILSFSVMQKNGYWWESLYLLTAHTFFEKPASYRAPGELWQITLGMTSLTNNLNLPKNS